MADVAVPYVFRLFWIAPILAGALLALSSLSNYLAAESSADWMPVDAEIIRIGGQRGFLVSQQWGTYRWRQGGSEYTGSDIDCCKGSWGDYFAEAGTRQSGDRVQAFIDPADPSRAVLRTGSQRHCLMPVGVGIALVCAGVIIRRRILTGDIARSRHM